MKRKGQIELVYEDETLLIVNKASGLLTLPDRFRPELPNVKDILAAKYGQIWVVHRLDKDTSGILCFAKNETAHRDLSMQFENRTVGKKYLALVQGSSVQEKGEIDRAIAPNPHQPGKMIILKSGKPSLTLYKKVEAFKGYSLLEVEIKTGRTHQIRVHLKAIGCPLAIDPIYHENDGILLSAIKGRSYHLGKDQVERPLMNRLSLHAMQLSFDHPVTKERMDFEGPLHKDFEAVLKQLRKWG